MGNFCFEIRVCRNCGLRYPLTERHPFGARCPQCLGETKVVLQKETKDEAAEGEESQAETARKAALLDNIRSAWNTGSILRSADGFGFSHAYLCGITPSPETDAVQKTALGAEKYVSWSQHKDALQLAKRLKSEGWIIGALEEDRRAVSLSDSRLSRLQSPFALAVGNEITGVDPELLDLSDFIFYIPMRGKKRSFNVASAFSIAAYALSRSFQIDIRRAR